MFRKIITAAVIGLSLATSAAAEPMVYNKGWEIGPSQEGYFSEHICTAAIQWKNEKWLSISTISFNEWAVIFAHPILSRLYGNIPEPSTYFLKFSHLRGSFRIHTYLEDGILYVSGNQDLVEHMQKAHYVDLYSTRGKIARYKLDGSTFAIGALRMCLSYEKNKRKDK